MSELVFLTPENAEFYQNTGGFIGLKYAGNDYRRISLYKAFPFSYEHKYISVRDDEQREIGIIEDLKTFPDNIAELCNRELSRRYYMPTIIKINSIKDEFGYSYWDVLTNYGNKKFVIRRSNNTFINIKGNMVLIIDVDGNRYEISDYTALDKKSFRLIELML